MAVELQINVTDLIGSTFRKFTMREFTVQYIPEEVAPKPGMLDRLKDEASRKILESEWLPVTAKYRHAGPLVTVTFFCTKRHPIPVDAENLRMMGVLVRRLWSEAFTDFLVKEGR